MPRSAALLIAALVASACGGGAAEPAAPGRPPRRERVATPAAPADATVMSSWEIAKVPEGTFGPYVGHRHGSAIVLWAAPVEQQRAWFGRPIDEAGQPRGEAFRVGEAPADVGLVAVRALGTAHSPIAGFVVLSTAREFSGERVDSLALSEQGKLVGGPTPLVQSLPNVVWVDAVPTKEGAIALWAVKRSGQASLHAVAIGAGAEPRSAPVEIVSDARAWQVAPVAGGAAVAVVAASAGSRGGPVSVAYVDDEGALEGRTVVVSKSPTAEPDIDMIAVEDHLVLAWSDRRYSDPRVVSAVVGPSGTLLSEPKPLTRARGPEALLHLVPPHGPGAPAFVAWEEQLDRPAIGRHIHLGRVGKDGALSSHSATVVHAAADGSVPELEATPQGLALLTLASACRRGAPCDEERVVPTFATLGSDLDVLGSEPVRLDVLGGAAAELTWGLTCRSEGCLALAALPTSPAPVYSVRLGGGDTEWLPAVEKDVPGPPPRVATIDVIGEADSLSGIATATVDGQTLVAWLSYFDPSIPYERPDKPAPDGRMAPVRAVLRVAPVQGAAPAEPRVISYRARSLGGVALAADADGKRALLAWSALEKDEPQLFVTQILGGGRKSIQRMLTRAKGSVSDVAVAPVDGGWIVAWIDGRHGAGDVYATRLDAQLRRVGVEQRLTPSAGNTSGVVLLPRGEHVFVAWADARGQEAGVGDIFVGRLSSKDATLVGTGTRLTRTEENSHSPVLAAFGTGAMVGWLEESVGTAEGQARLLLRRLDSGAEPASAAESVPLGGRAMAADMECDDRLCRVAVTRTTPRGAVLSGLSFAPGRDASPTDMVALESAPEEAVAPVISGSDVLYGDQSAEGFARVRRLSVTWVDAPASAQSPE